MEKRTGKYTLSRIAACLGITCGALVATAAGAGVVSNYTAWSVGGNTTDSGGQVTFTAGASASPVWQSGQSGNKAYYSTDAANGLRVGQLNSLTYNCVSGCSNTGLPGGPYANIFVVDPLNSANKAILLVLPTSSGNTGNLDFSQETYTIFEGTGTFTALNNTTVGFNVVNDLLIANGPYTGTVEPVGGWAAYAGTGGTDDGFALVWGNRSGAASYANPVTIDAIALNIPEPGSLALVSVALAGLVTLRRRKTPA